MALKTVIHNEKKYSILPKLKLTKEGAEKFERAIENPPEPNSLLKEIFNKIKSSQR